MRNEQHIKRQIELKKQSEPYYANISDAKEIITDYDTFPYSRWYRGIPESSNPIIAEREAGWRVRHDDCYNDTKSCFVKQDLIPEHCFETACSTVFPCFPGYLKKYSDKKALDVMLNDVCIVQYR